MISDVVVVGAGIAGLSTGWRLAQVGWKVTIVDRGPPGGEATAAAAGLLSAQAEGEAAGPFFDLLVAAERGYPAAVAELTEASGQTVDLRFHGVLQLAAGAAQLDELAARAVWQAAAGLRAERLEPDELLRLEPALEPRAAEPGALDSRFAGGLFFPSAGQVDNRGLARALALALQRRGVHFERGEAQAIELASNQGEGRVGGVRVSGRTLPAGAVVVAAGAWSSLLAGTGLPAAAVVPVRGQMLRLLTPHSLLRRPVFGAGGYAVPRWDGATLVGSTMERGGFGKDTSAAARAALLTRAAALVPALATAPLAEHWAGLRPATTDGLPALGATPIAGLHLAVGLLRNGILLGPQVGSLVARALGGEAEAIPVPFRAERLYVRS